ncbi:YccF domain-containing protein [Alloscardovia theropitheci]|uniref:YccF domain-containing protein n=1 Tax=Alloscardovia theropitheci TaxID=2496842 RepID=A0A4R0QXX9_9BIFI|nr:YccF domain-containing protein [Alloscardovia theropitheci]TCD54381.1 YccF domain-containing protein [Alloscardovia theropitheci]
MRTLGNILWIILGGASIAASWFFVGLVLCITIIGIPLGLQCFKMGWLTLMPFGQTVTYGGSFLSMLGNVIWAVTVGWILAVLYLFAGLLNCITIIGIPFGIQSFKMMKLAFAPFGATVTPNYY